MRYDLVARCDVHRGRVEVDVAVCVPRTLSPRSDTIYMRLPDSAEVRPLTEDLEGTWSVNGVRATVVMIGRYMQLTSHVADDSATVTVRGRVAYECTPAMRFTSAGRRGFILDEWFPEYRGVEVARSTTPQRDAVNEVATYRIALIVPANAGVVASGLQAPCAPAESAVPCNTHSITWSLHDSPMATVVVSEGLCVYPDSASALTPRITVAGARPLKHAAVLRSTVRSLIDSYTALYGPLPYSHVAVAVLPHKMDAEAATGAGIIVLNGGSSPRAFSRGAVAHEVAHLWWGGSMGAQANVLWFFEGLASYSRELAAHTDSARGRLPQPPMWEKLGTWMDGLAWRGVVRSGGDIPLSDASSSDQSDVAVVVTYAKSLAFLRAVGDSVGAPVLGAALRRLYARTRGTVLREQDVRQTIAEAESLSGRSAHAAVWMSDRMNPPPPRRVRPRILPPTTDEFGRVVFGADAVWSSSGFRSAYISTGFTTTSGDNHPSWHATAGVEWKQRCHPVIGTERLTTTAREQWRAVGQVSSPSDAATSWRWTAALGVASRRDALPVGSQHVWEQGRTSAIEGVYQIATPRSGRACAAHVRGKVGVVMARERAAGIEWGMRAVHALRLQDVQIRVRTAVAAVGGAPLLQDMLDPATTGALRSVHPGKIRARGVRSLSLEVTPRLARNLHLFATGADLSHARQWSAKGLTELPRGWWTAEAGVGVAVGPIEGPRVVVDVPLWTSTVQTRPRVSLTIEN